MGSIGLVSNAFGNKGLGGLTSGVFGSSGVFKSLRRGLGIDQYEVDRSVFNPTAEEASFTQELIRAARGEVPSAAENQQRRGLEKAVAAAQAQAASQRGINPGLAARLASQNLGQTQQEIIGQAGTMRAQEQAAARNLLASAFASQRGSRIQGELANQQAFDSAASKLSETISNAGKAAAGSAGMAYGGIAIDSPQNDVVPAMLSPGEIVVPRSVVDMGPEAISKFAQSLARFAK
jgi:hypothetical protein